MAMMGANNIAAQMALGELNKNSSILRKTLEKVSNGMKINSAKDSAANYVISEKMREQIRSLEQDHQNVQNGAALVKVAEDGINNIVDELRNLKELAINAANDTNTDGDRATIQKEFEQKMANINDIANSTNYNGIILLDGRWKQVIGDGEMVTLTGTKTVIGGYETQDTIETVAVDTPTLIPDTVSTVISSPYTSITGYYLDDSEYSYPTVISSPYTSITGYYTEDSPYSYPTVISEPYTSITGYYAQDTPYTRTVDKPYTDIDGISLQPYTESTTVPTISTSYTGYYLNYKTLDPPKVPSLSEYSQTIFFEEVSLRDGAYHYTVTSNNFTYHIVKEFKQGGHARNKPLIITIPSTVTNVAFSDWGDTLCNIFFEVESNNTNIWLDNLDLVYTNSDRSVIKFNGSGKDNTLQLAGDNTISMSGAMTDKAIIDVGNNDFIIQKQATLSGGPLTVNVNTTLNGAVVGSNANSTVNSNINSFGNLRVNVIAPEGRLNGASLGAGAGGSINGSVMTSGILSERVPVTVTVEGAPPAYPPTTSTITTLLPDYRTAFLSLPPETISSSVPTVISGTRPVDIENITLEGVHTFSPPASTVISGTPVTLTSYETVNVPTVISGTETVSVAVNDTLDGVQTFDIPAPTVMNGEYVTLTGYETLSTDVPTIISGTETVSVAVSDTLEGIQTFDIPAPTVMNGEYVTLTGYETLSTDVPTVISGTETVSVAVSDTLEGIQTFDIPAPTVMNGEYVTLTGWETLNSTMESFVPTLRPDTVTSYETIPSTIDVPIYETETFEYEMQVDVLQNPLKIHHGTQANQHLPIYIGDLRTKALGTSDLIEEDGFFMNFMNAEDEQLYYALSYDEKKCAAFIETLKLAQNKSLDDIDVKTKSHANVAIRVLDGAIDTALLESVRMGAYLQHLDFMDANIITMGENVQAAESTIRDADMAKEITEYTKASILTQAAQSMLAQANQNSSAVLSLLQ